MAVPFLAHAEDANGHNGMYVTVGGGTVDFRGINPSNFEKSVMANPNFTTTSSMHTKSSDRQIGVGYHINKYISIEGTYIDGVSISTATTITQYNGTTLNIMGNPVVVPAIPLNIVMRREATLTAMQAAVLLKYPFMNDKVDVFARPAVTKYKGDIAYKLDIPNQQGISLYKKESDGGTAVSISFGADYYFAKNWGARVDYLGLGSKKVKMLTVAIEYQF